MKSLFFLSFLIVFTIEAKTMSSLTVKELKYIEEKKVYSVKFNQRAGLYHTSEKWLSCLEKSIQAKHPVSVTYNVSDLEIIECSEKL